MKYYLLTIVWCMQPHSHIYFQLPASINAYAVPYKLKPTIKRNSVTFSITWIMSKRMLIARSILTSGPGQLTLYDFQTAAKKRKASLNTRDGAAWSSRQGETCVSQECSSRDKDHKVGLCSLHEANETPEAEGSYSMIRCDLDFSYTHPVPWIPVS